MKSDNPFIIKCRCSTNNPFIKSSQKISKNNPFKPIINIKCNACGLPIK